LRSETDASLRILRTTPQRICVLGSNACARQIADRLARSGLDVVLATSEDARDPRNRDDPGDQSPRVEALFGARLQACNGQIGQFELVFGCGGTLVRRTAAAVVLAESDTRSPEDAPPGLPPQAVMPLSAFLGAGCRPPEGAPPWQQIVFMNGLRTESHPAMAGSIMRAALQLQSEQAAQCCILTRNLKVAAEGLEALSREARAAGVQFFKFTASAPTLSQEEDGKPGIRFVDEPTGAAFLLKPDLVVVDETVRPSARAVELGQILGIESGPEGFLQGDNVHRLPAATNRRGVVVAGPARAVGLDPEAEASGAVMEVLMQLAAEPRDPSTAARIEPGRCIRCLTCLRVCPHCAVALDGRPQVLPDACERCGICAAECPREAIRIAGLERGDLRRLVSAGAAAEGPRIVAFACRRSAAPALREAFAARGGLNGALHLIEVPCAGSLAPEVVLSAFQTGADGVLVLACHADNCYSRHGNRLARQRTDLAAAFLDRCGAGTGRLAFKTLASNMPAEAAAIAAEFSAILAGLKSNARLKQTP
jgi:coenzyme F420-reducing hydrogenase delta subunit/ferredoxin